MEGLQALLNPWREMTPFAQEAPDNGQAGHLPRFPHFQPARKGGIRAAKNHKRQTRPPGTSPPLLSAGCSGGQSQLHPLSCSQGAPASTAFLSLKAQAWATGVLQRKSPQHRRLIVKTKTLNRYADCHL